MQYPVQADTPEEMRDVVVEKLRAAAKQYRDQATTDKRVYVKKAGQVAASVCDNQADLFAAMTIKRK